MATVSLKSKAFKMEGVPQLLKLVKEISNTLAGASKTAFDDQVRGAMLKPALMIADEARDMAPVVTGTLRNSIKAKPLTKRVGAIVFTEGVRYAAMVEFGTSKTHAQPYFRPGVNAVRPTAANVMSEGLAKVIDGITQSGAWHEKDGTPT